MRRAATHSLGVPHVVVGEAEELAAELVADMRAGTLRPLYQAAALPRPLADAAAALGPARPAPLRHDVGAVVPRLPVRLRVLRRRGAERAPAAHEVARAVHRRTGGLRALGWQGPVFVVDDNFIGDRRRCRELLLAIIDWRARTRARMTFLTEASVNMADDPELLELMVTAGFKKVFLGIETPSAESLRECHKLQNLRGDLADRRAHDPARRSRGHGRLHRRLRQRRARHLRAPVRVHPEGRRGHGHGRPAAGHARAAASTSAWPARAGCARRATATTPSAVFNFEPRLDREFLIENYRAPDAPPLRAERLLPAHPHLPRRPPHARPADRR